MTEDEAKAWLVATLVVSRETIAQLERLAAAIIEENGRQNLISAGTIPAIWHRHIVDSAQLLPLAGVQRGTSPWLDLGTGAGFPGLVVACLSEQPMILVESRRKRFEFLAKTADALGLGHVTVHGGGLDTLESCATGVISARAFAPLPRLLDAAIRFSRKRTIWILPKGRSAREELASASPAWHGEFEVKQSVTDADAAIIVARTVQKRK
ncbi:MAG: 16S rRNA (guanine(527)-N(7))-methyltransferase RsmG [Sphingomonadaceae bacterium]